MRRKSLGGSIEVAKILFCEEIHRLLREYGAVRLAKLDTTYDGRADRLVIFSPIFCVPGDVQLPAACVLDSRLYALGELAYGTMRRAVQEVCAGKSS